MIEWLESYFAKKISPCYGDARRFLLGTCLQRNHRIGQWKIIPIQRKLFLLFREKRGTNRIRKFECGQSSKFVYQRIGMDASPAESENDKSKSRQDDFYVIKEKAQSRRRENKVELENQYGTNGSKIIELTRFPKNLKTA